MKKLLSLLSILSLLFVNTVNLISCGNIANNNPHLPTNSDNELKVNSKTNIDLDKSYLSHSTLMQKRGYKGIFFNQYKIDTIKNLTNAFLSKAENINLLINFKTEFSSYEQLQGYLKSKKQYFWQNLINNICQKYQIDLKQLILSFYNFVATIWNKINVSEILKKIEVKNIIDNNSNILGQANNHQTILINKAILSCSFEKNINNEWKKGQFTTNDFFHVIAHELGHIFYFYDWEMLKINHIFYLKQFLAKKINNLNKHTELNEEKLLKIFVNSNISNTKKLILTYNIIRQVFLYSFKSISPWIFLNLVKSHFQKQQSNPITAIVPIIPSIVFNIIHTSFVFLFLICGK